MENLQVELIHLYPKENSVPHKTDQFEAVQDEMEPMPILRRGFKFTMAVNFGGRGYNEKHDVIRLVFSFGKFPNAIKGTKAFITIHPKRVMPVDRNRWYGNILAKGLETLTMEVFIPADTPVGVWNLKVETRVANTEKEPSIFNYDTEIFVLFNPWCKDDLVYMPDHRLLDEYVLNDVGKIWVGPMGSSRGREWVFGQFDACVLPAAMLMFERSELPFVSRGDPIKVSRTISKLVNSNDDDGIVVGKWDGEYEDGTAPAAWSGSAPILLQFLTTQKPVGYGQCWIFSGVVTTICRALGIPSRVVSNLVSAHDANASLTVDKYFNVDNEEIDDPLNPSGADSIWNYHVWNDVWMARPDLPKGYGGWQAIDATPQEQSHGFFQCGPASLEAIKQGHVGYNYDVGFLVASVNADLMRWKEDPKSDLGYSKIYCNKYHIGRLVLTKRPFLFDPNGDRDKEDITHEYKQNEGTEAERLCLYNAVRGTSLAKTFYSLPDSNFEDISFDLDELDKIQIGQNFQVSVKLKNMSDQERTIKALLSTSSVFYTGVKANEVKKVKGTFKMKPKQSETLLMTVTADEYIPKLVEYCIMKLHAVATVVETRQTWADEDDFQVLKPHIDIRMATKVPTGRITTITLRFANPLKKFLTNCKFRIAGSGLIRNQIIPYPDVKPRGLVKIDCNIRPRIDGEQKIIATFSSRELVDITGTAKFEVVPNEE